MPSQRKKGVARLTVTLPDSMLANLEKAAEDASMDRLELIRRAIQRYITNSPTKVKSSAKKTK